MALKLPKSKSQWFVVVGCFVFITIDIYTDYFFTFDPMIATDAQFFNHWLLRAIRDVSLTIFLSGITILGIRSLRRNGFSIRRFILPAFAVLFFLFLTVLSLFGHIEISHIQRNLLDAPHRFKENLKKCLDSKDLSLSQRSKFSLMYARQIWTETGENIEYVTSDGKKRIYEPSLEEIESKKKIRRANEVMTWSLKRLKRAYIFWPVVAIISVAIGFFTRIKKHTQFSEK